MFNGSRADANSEGLLAEPQPLVPKCPHCKADPARIAATFIKIGGNTAVLFFCGNPACRKIHSVAPVQLQPPAPPERSPLAI